MGRINRRIYATRRKKSSAFKMFAPPAGHKRGRGQRGRRQHRAEQMSQMQESINEGVYGGFGGTIRSMKYMVDNAKPPYLNETGGDELGIGGGKTYTITEV